MLKRRLYSYIKVIPTKDGLKIKGGLRTIATLLDKRISFDKGITVLIYNGCLCATSSTKVYYDEDTSTIRSVGYEQNEILFPR